MAMAKSDTSPSLEHLRCVDCNLYLSVGPVRLVDGGHYKCGRCSSDDESDDGNVVTIYSVVAQSFLFPCRYESSGCTEKLPYGQMEQHEVVCDKQPFFCPSLKDCEWYGLKKNVHRHYLLEHPEDVVENNKPIRLRVKDGNSKRVVLYVCGKTMFVVDLLFSEATGLTMCVMQCGLEHDAPNKYNLRLYNEHGTKELWLNSLEISFYLNSRNPELMKNETVHTEVLRYLEADELQLELHFLPQEEKDPLKILECPLCIEYMVPPIYLCDIGHSFCHSCTKKVNVCSFCKSRFTTRRNYALENFADIAYPTCRNSRLGCNFRSTLEEVKRHELSCERYQCPMLAGDDDDEPEFDNCTWYSTYEEMVAHSRSTHLCIERDNFSGTCNVQADKESFLLFFTHGFLFKLCSRTVVTKMMQLNAQFVGPKDKVDYFGFVVEFKTGKNRLVYHRPCQLLIDQRNPFEDCLTIPYDILVPFMENRGIVKVHLQIVKVVDKTDD